MLMKRKPSIDPPKIAIYNPKEFRGRRSLANEETAASSRLSWRSIIVIAIVVGLSVYFWNGRVKTTPPVASPLPLSGTVERLRQEPSGMVYGPLKLIGNRDGRHCMFRLEDWKSGAPVLEVFVRSGETAETAVPLGQYRGKITCGSTWYGTQLFGPGTAIDQLTAPLVFTRNEAGGVRGMVIELTQRLGGNLHSQQSNF